MVYIFILILIVLDGYFSLAEIALIAVKPVDVQLEMNKNNPNAKLVLELIKNPDVFLSSVQVGSTLIGLMEGVYGGNLIASPLVKLLISHNVTPLFAHTFSVVLSVAGVTYLTIVIGDLVPKSVGFQNPLKMALAIAPSLTIFNKLIYPFIRLLTWSSQRILELLKIKKNDKKITENDLQELLSMAYKQGLLGLQELRMYENLYIIKSLTAGRIMKPAKLIVSLDRGWPAKKVFKIIEKKNYSTMPVYEGEKKNIIGIIDVKQFLIYKKDDWRSVIKPPDVIPSEMPARDIFNHFREQNINFAIVNDDNKQYIGIVAMQDIMESVFGDIPEQENYAAYFYQQSGNVWIAEGFIHLQRIRKTIGLPWMRTYERKYLSIAELIAGEAGLFGDDDILRLNDVQFLILTGTRSDAVKIQITLPSVLPV